MTPDTLAADPRNAAKPARKPRFRAEHIGGLLRPDTLNKALAIKGLEPEALAEVEDAAIVAAVAMQQDIGLPAVTDGAFRNTARQDFIAALTGMDTVARAAGVDPDGATPDGAPLTAMRPIVADRLDFPDDHPMLSHFRHLASVAKATPKIAIPGPGCLVLRVAKADIAPQDYRDEETVFADLATTWRKAVAAFYAAGCRYLQLDDSYFAHLSDPKRRAGKPAEETDRALRRYAAIIDAAIAGRPADMTVALRLRRDAGEAASGAALDDDALAEAVFSTDADIFFMPFDSARPKGFAPLRFLPNGPKRAMPGLIDSRTPKLETLDALKRGFDAASQCAEMDQLGLAPQSGFSATDPLTEDDQKRKLDLVVRAADALWGRLDG